MRSAIAALLASVCVAIGCGAPTGRGVVLVVVDTLRADHLHLYGYERRTSDGLDRLAARGWVFDNHISHASQTVPSTLSLLLSRLPADHGHVHRKLGQFMERRPRFAEDLVFLAEAFRDHGWDTAGFVSNPFLNRHTGFAQGLATFEHWPGDVMGEGAEIADRAVAWLRALPRHRPFFLYVHLMDVHSPYEQPEPFRSLFPPAMQGSAIAAYGRDLAPTEAELAATVAHYDSAIAYTDAQLERVLAALQDSGRRATTTIAVTSDHGEEFMEHGGLGHATTAFGELVRVPLILVDASLDPGRRVAHLSRHLDVAPTLLSLAGVPVPESFRGRSLLEPVDTVYAEGGPWRAAQDAEWKLVRNVETGQELVFASGDRLDSVPRGDVRVEAKLRARLDRERMSEDASRARPESGHPWSADDVERLRALGYAEPETR